MSRLLARRCATAALGAMMEAAGADAGRSPKGPMTSVAATDGRRDPAGAESRDDGGGEAPETEPDARFTFANERTFLALTRTALAFVVAGLAIAQLLPPFPGVPGGREALGVPLIILGGVIAVVGYVQWSRNQQALRRGAPMPASILPRVLSVTIAAMAVAAAIVLLVSALLKQ